MGMVIALYDALEKTYGHFPPEGDSEGADIEIPTLTKPNMHAKVKFPEKDIEKSLNSLGRPGAAL